MSEGLRKFFSVMLFVGGIGFLVQMIRVNDMAAENAMLKAQLVVAQPKDDGAVVYVWPPVDPIREEVSLDRVTWTDEKGQDHVWACGEIAGNGRISRYGRLVGINRVGWPIAEIANVIE